MEQDFLRKQKNKKLKKNLILLCLALVAIAKGTGQKARRCEGDHRDTLR